MSIAVLEVELLPLGAVRPAVEDLRQAAGLLDQLPRGRALRAQRPLVDRGARVALDADELATARVDDLAAAHRAVRADRLGDVEPGDPAARLFRVSCETARGTEPPVRGAPDERQVAQPVERLGAMAVAHRRRTTRRVVISSVCLVSVLPITAGVERAGRPRVPGDRSGATRGLRGGLSRVSAINPPSFGTETSPPALSWSVVIEALRWLCGSARPALLHQLTCGDHAGFGSVSSLVPSSSTSSGDSGAGSSRT